MAWCVITQISAWMTLLLPFYLKCSRISWFYHHHSQVSNMFSLYAETFPLLMPITFPVLTLGASVHRTVTHVYWLAVAWSYRFLNYTVTLHRITSPLYYSPPPSRNPYNLNMDDTLFSSSSFPKLRNLLTNMSVSHTTLPVNNEVESVCKEAVAICFKVLSRHVLGRTEENNEKPQPG
jgi:hypothetical protein